MKSNMLSIMKQKRKGLTPFERFRLLNEKPEDFEGGNDTMIVSGAQIPSSSGIEYRPTKKARRQDSVHIDGDHQVSPRPLMTNGIETVLHAAYCVSEEESVQTKDDDSCSSAVNSEAEVEQEQSFNSNSKKSEEVNYIPIVQRKKSITRMTFKDYFEQMKAFKREHGHVRVTPKYDKKLAAWVADMRNIRRQKNKSYGRKVTEEQLKALDSLGFVWNPTQEEGGEKSFEFRIKQLKAFREKFGHCRVTIKHDKNLAYFCSNIRAARRHPGRRRILKVTEERIKALDRLGFAWEPKPTQGDLAFWAHIEELKRFKEVYGHVHVTGRLDKKLAIFCTNMRNARRKTHTTRRLTDERIKALDNLGFIWDPGQERNYTSFEERIEQLKAFKDRHGHVNVTSDIDKKLASFCVCVRRARQYPGRGRMVVTAERIEALDAIGFEWDTIQDKYFTDSFEQLRAFKEKNGHILHGLDENLVTFCNRIRNARQYLEKRGRSLPSEGRIEELDKLGFKWD